MCFLRATRQVRDEAQENPQEAAPRAASLGSTCLRTNRSCFFWHQRLVSRNACEPFPLPESPYSELCHGSCLGPTYLRSRSLLKGKGLSASAATVSSPGSSAKGTRAQAA